MIPSWSVFAGARVDMLYLKFKSASASWTIGPADFIALRGPEVVFPHHPSPVARYDSGWVLEGKRCNYVECRALLSVQFEDSTGQVGPVIGLRTTFYLRGMYAFAGRERIAKLEPLANAWLRTDTQESWPQLRILPAP